MRYCLPRLRMPFLRTLKATTVAKRSGVVVFGEIVAVLWAQKKYNAAVRIEELWNEPAMAYSFRLCAAYPANASRDGLTLVPYAEFCAQHSDVVSGVLAFAVPHGKGGRRPRPTFAMPEASS